MNLTDNEILKFQKGSPILLDDVCAIYPAKLGEIVDLGYDKFQQYLSVITMVKPPLKDDMDKDLREILKNVTDFQYLILMAMMDQKMNSVLKEAFQFFIHDTIIFSLEPAQIVVGPIEEKHLLTEDNFYDFQRIIRRAFFLEVEGEEIVINKDDDSEVAALKMKMRENREKLRKAKAKKAQREHSDLKLSDLIGSMTINNCGLNMVNIWDMTYYAFYEQLKRMGWRDQFNINNQAAMAGAKLKKSQLKHWMRSIANDDKND